MAKGRLATIRSIRTKTGVRCEKIYPVNQPENGLGKTVAIHFDKKQTIELISLLALAVTSWDRVTITAFRDPNRVTVTTQVKNVRVD